MGANLGVEMGSVHKMPEAKVSNDTTKKTKEKPPSEVRPSTRTSVEDNLHRLPSTNRDMHMLSGAESMTPTLETDAESLRGGHRSRSSSVDSLTSVRRPPRPLPNMFD